MCWWVLGENKVACWHLHKPVSWPVQGARVGVSLMAAEVPTEEMEHLTVGEGGEDEESAEEVHTGEPGGASHPCPRLLSAMWQVGAFNQPCC